MLRTIKRVFNKLFGWPNLEFNDTVHWVSDCTQYVPADKPVFSEQAAWLLANPKVSIMIEGYCDELEGSREHCLLLGVQRASAHQAQIVRLGVDPARIKTISYGRERPGYNPAVDPNANAKNRRTILRTY